MEEDTSGWMLYTWKFIANDSSFNFIFSHSKLFAVVIKPYSGYIKLITDETSLTLLMGTLILKASIK